NDSSGNNLNGTVNGAVLTEDRFGNSSSAFNFDGIDDYILVNDDDLLSFPNNEFTFSFWVNPTLTQLPASPAFEEDFEATPNAIYSINFWAGDLSVTVQNDKWVWHSGATASAGTGPNGAQSGSKYCYYETSIPGDYHSVPYHGSMYSPAIDLTTSDSSELSFYFHAYGAKMGTLNVKVGSSSLGYTTVYTLSGQQQTSSSAPWQNVTVDLSAFLGEVVQLEFEYTSQIGQDCFTGDIAIDNITVSQSTQYSYSPKIGIMGKREFSQPYVLDWEYNIFGTIDTTVGLVCWTNNGQNGVFGDGQSVLHSMNFTPGIWTNFIYSSDGDSLRYYKNGVKLGTIPKNTSGLNLSNQDGDLTFGLAGAWNQFNYLDGKLDDILMYDRALTQTEIDSISPPIPGCTDPNAQNFYPGATIDDGSCLYGGCTDPTAQNYDPAATVDDGSCSFPCLPDTSYTNITACDSVVWNGNTYNSSGTYTGSSVSNNYSASLDGINDYVDVGNNSVLDIDNSVTIEAWINPSNLSNRHAIYSTRKNNNPGSFQLEIGTYSGVGTNYVAVTGVGTWVAITGSNVINNNGGWVHIAYTRDGVGNNHEIYINGIPQIINTSPYTFINNNSLKEIGRGTTAIQNYDGQIDQVRIWDIALTQLEIQNYINCPPTGNELGLVGYWNFEEGSGTTAYDLTSNGNDGAING
ncbi:choice-of-anchor J domain-containing protein, partial [Flavobacteriales bacterium]|nr:choice-of-anchor J domain-containing protein [Flavobacteriales bacterium]